MQNIKRKALFCELNLVLCEAHYATPSFMLNLSSPQKVEQDICSSCETECSDRKGCLTDLSSLGNIERH
jgi:hypothetical protein